MLVVEYPASGHVVTWQYNRLSTAPLSRAWSECSIPEAKIHRIHSYPAKFPAFLVQKAFEYAAQQGTSVKRVADVFCGSGTVACEAAANNLEFWGCDINPIATLISRVKNLRLDPLRFRKLSNDIVQRFETATISSDLSANAVERLKPWYGSKEFDDLVKLRNAIISEVGISGEDALAFECAFSAILKPVSKWRSRATKPAKDEGKRSPNAIDAFQRQCWIMERAWTEVAPSPRPASEIIQGNVTQVSGPSKAVDLIVTSPPYATSYEYADLHQLSSLWLGFADDHRDLRTGVIGTSSRRASLSVAVRELNSVGMQVVFSLFEKNRSIAEATAAYFLDMQKVAERCWEFLRPGGISVFVIGNTQIHGVRVDNANHLVESLLNVGFVNVRVVRRNLFNKPNTPYRLPNGRLTTTRTSMQIYAEEYIVMAQRR